MTPPPWLTARPFAHRGLHDKAAALPENTLGAAAAAIAGGYGIECDVQISADGEVVVFHDHDLDRLTAATGPVRSLPASEISALAVHGTAERVPTLAAFLDCIGGRTPLVIELKSRFDGDERLVARLAELLGGRDAPIAVKSFDPAVVTLLRHRLPERPRGIVAQARYEDGEWAKLAPEQRQRMANLLHWDETRPDFLSWQHRDLPSAAPHLGRLLAGTPVMTWTVRNRGDATRALAHADQIVFEGYRPD